MTDTVQTLRHEVGRKTVHLSTLVLPAWAYWGPEAWRQRGLLLAFFFGLGLDLLRLYWPPCGRWMRARIGRYLRADEEARLVSAHYLTLAAVVLGWTVPRAIAAAALGYLVLGDAAAALVGRRFGRHRVWGKSLEGSLACFLCCLVLGWMLLPGRPLAVFGGALVATLAEALPLPVDDNWSVPLLSAAALVALA